MGFKLGVYRHFKNGNLYLVYDITVDEQTQKEKVSYMGLVDGKKYSRFIERFTEDVSDRSDNKTGQKQRFENYQFDFSSLNFSPSDIPISDNITQLIKLDTPIEKIIHEFTITGKVD